jgi:hypothetical protein
MEGRVALPSELFDANKDDITSYLHDFHLGDKLEALETARESGNEQDIAWAAHYAWVKLPDHPHIRYGGFFPLCRIAEQIF